MLSPLQADRTFEHLLEVGHHGVVAGGMSKRGNWGTLADRITHTQETAAPAPAPPPIKPCWVTDRHGRLPGLLLEWRRTDAGFHGRVVRAVIDDHGDWIVVEEWLPAELLERG